MRKLKTIEKKNVKARARRKDFSKKRNVRQNNWPTPRFEVEQPVMKAHRDDKGKTTYKQVDTKVVKMKGAKRLLTPGDGILPISKKVKLSKKEKTKLKKSLFNLIADQTAN